MKFLTFLKQNYNILLTFLLAFGGTYYLLWRNLDIVYSNIERILEPYGQFLYITGLFIISFIVCMISIIIPCIITVEVTKYLNKQNEE